uniref:Uncharacterized protein n=1 Tax=Clytia hemisphaerica TaxID=252671 RepID=A0A7M5UU79_9CNID
MVILYFIYPWLNFLTFLFAIDGDGMVCKVSIVDGKVHFCSKFVKSKHRRKEQEERKFIYPGQMGTRNESKIKDTIGAISSLATGNPSAIIFRNPSNTNAFYWGRKILALYETHLPHSLDPYTLETLGLDNLGGNLKLGNCAVHFRIDPHTKRLVLFSLRPGLQKLPSLVIYEFDEKWNLTKEMKLHIPFLNYAHDFLLFPDYYLFHITPFTHVSMWGAMKILGGWESPGESMRHYPSLPSQFVVIPRNAKSESDVMKIDTCRYHIFHYGTCQQLSKTKLSFNTICMDEKFNMNFTNYWLSNMDISPGYPFQFELDLETLKGTHKRIDTCCAEFPTSHPYRNGMKGTRYIYLMASDRKEHLPFRDVVKIDTATSKKTVWYSDGIIGEPCFIPKYGYQSTYKGDEDEGYVIVQLYHFQTHKTHFCILDAKHVERGPIARIKLQHHVPYGFHGSFTPEVFLFERLPTLKAKL